MRLLFISGWYPPHVRGGGEVSAHLLAQGLLARGHEVRVVTAGEHREETLYEGIPVLRLPLGLAAKPLFEQRHSWRLAYKLSREIDLDSFEILHAHDFRSALLLAELSHITVPTVWTVRDYAAVCGTTNAVLVDGSRCTCSWRDLWRTQRVQEASWVRKPFRLWQYKYNINYRRRVLGSFPGQVFISRAQREEIEQQLAARAPHATVIYNSVPPDFLERRPVAAVTGSVLYAGTVESYKGVGLLLDVWREIARKVAGAKLTIAGEGAQRGQYERAVERAGLQYSVHFAGRLDRVRLRRYIDEASVVVAPAQWIEPFGRTVAEAMARGKIVVASNSGGPSEMVTHERTGLLFERGSKTALFRQLMNALTMPVLKRRGIEQAARHWAREHLSPDTIARQYEEFYALVKDYPLHAGGLTCECVIFRLRENA